MPLRWPALLARPVFLLPAFGIYGVRMARGRGVGQIWRAFSVEGTRLIAIALAIPVALCFGIGRLLRDLLYGVPPLNPLMVATAAAAFAAVWLGGIYLPARRATAVDPSRALRWE
jgi:putative ABC transport system permease protein